MKRNIVLFDLGSTLIYYDGDWENFWEIGAVKLAETLIENGYGNHQAGFMDAFSSAFSQQMHQYLYERKRNLVELSSAAVLTRVLKSFDIDNVPDTVVRHSLREMYAISQSRWHLDEEALPALDDLHQQGFRLGIVSNASDDEDVQTLIRQNGLAQYFDVILSSASIGFRKPHPGLFKAALDHFDANAQQAVMIGDTIEADIVGAKKLGIAAVWITRWANPSQNLPLDQNEQPDAVISSLSELSAAVRQLLGK